MVRFRPIKKLRRLRQPSERNLQVFEAVRSLGEARLEQHARLDAELGPEEGPSEGATAGQGVKSNKSIRDSAVKCPTTALGDSQPTGANH